MSKSLEPSSQLEKGRTSFIKTKIIINNNYSLSTPAPHAHAHTGTHAHTHAPALFPLLIFTLQHHGTFMFTLIIHTTAKQNHITYTSTSAPDYFKLNHFFLLVR